MTYQLAEADRLIETRLVASPGSVEYYGTPTVKKSISGLGSVTSWAIAEDGVAKVEALLALCDALAAEVAAAEEVRARLLQAVLDGG